MKEKDFPKLYYFISILISILLIFTLHTYLRRGKYNNEIIIFENTPDHIRNILEKEFKDYNVKVSKENHLYYFLQDKSIVFIHDIEAYSLLGNKDYYFYPLYEDIIVIGLDKSYSGESIRSFKDLEKLDLSINIENTDPGLRYILASISYPSLGKLEINKGINYLDTLKDKGILSLDEGNSPLEINFANSLRKKNYHIIVPEEGTLSFMVGILSHQPIEDRIIDLLKQEAERLDYRNKLNLGGDKASISQANQLKDNFLRLEHHRKSLRRKILGEKKYAPVNAEEHQLVSLIIAGLIIIWIVQVNRRIIHTGVRLGLSLVGVSLIGLIILGIYKYALFEYSLAAHISWYLYYVFLLIMPVASLYIAENADRIENEELSIGIKISIGILIVFVILVLTNDYHQLTFRFLTDVFEERGDKYAYGIVFILLSVWYGLTQVAAFLLMLKKGLDSPDRRRVILPFIIMVVYLIYILMYNFRIKIVHDFPLVLGTSILQIIYWTSAIVSGLIPSNRAYYQLFKSSNLNMQIIDHDGNISYSAMEGSPLSLRVVSYLQSLGEDSKSQILEGDNLIWSSPISGGRVIAQENIKEINELRGMLEEATASLEEENLLLIKKEEVEKRLYLLDEQNRLAKEVHQGIKDRLKEMEELIVKIGEDPENKMKDLKQIHRIALYCKRKSELLIKSKNREDLPAQELCRIIHEMASMMPEAYSIFCQMDGRIKFSQAINIYEYYSSIMELGIRYDIEETMTRISKKSPIVTINILFDMKMKKYRHILEGSFEKKGNSLFSIKEFEDSMSIKLEIGGP